MVGRHVVEEVRRRGLDAVVIARSAGVDVTSGAGLAEALAGAATVIDASNVTTFGRKKAVAFFDAATRHLLDAETKAGVTHHVALSIVGCDRVDMGYYYGKRRQEELVEQGSVPWSLVRATQFHEFAGQMIDRSPVGVALAPKLRSQPISAAEVASILVDTAVDGPLHRTIDVAGPEELPMADMVRRVVRHRGVRRVVVPAPLPGRVGRQVADGGLLPRGDTTLGTVTFEDWLARQPAV